DDYKKKREAGFRAKSWNFLNSAFGIFFLSSIVIGLATLAYQKYRESTERQALNRKIEIELLSRWLAFQNIKDSSTRRVYYDDYDSGPFFFQYSSAYKEFEGRNFYSLYYELYKNTDGLYAQTNKEMMNLCKELPIFLSQVAELYRHDSGFILSDSLKQNKNKFIAAADNWAKSAERNNQD
ncbi:MAG TPA: hypothetical protein VD908_05215, partial [Cytophagales bacterium]|nr:hypothetical protein [Cytophagales bacterium]